MAEQIISPGVFTRENDLSFLPQGVGAIGAAIVGPTTKGPAFVPTVVRSFSEFERRFGPLSSETYVPQTVREYLKNAGSVTVVRVLGGSGFTYGTTKSAVAVALSGSGGANVIIGVLLPSKTTGDPTLHSTKAYGAGSLESGVFSVNFSASFNLELSSSNHPFSASINPANSDYLFKQLGDSPNNSLSAANTYAGTPGYTYINFKNQQTTIAGTGSGLFMTTDTFSVGSGSNIFFTTQSANIVFSGGESSQTEKYGFASTPFITSGFLDANNVLPKTTTKNLFKFHTLDHGKTLSKEFKISIANLKDPGTIDGVEQYMTFSVILRRANDKDKNPIVLEQYNNVNLDPDSPRYISRVIGDRFPQYNDTLDKVELLGNFSNISNYIRVEVDATVEARAIDPKLGPKGFAAVTNPILPASFYWPSPTALVFPSASYEGVQQTGTDNTYSSRGYLGFKFADKESDNMNFLLPMPDSAPANVSGKFNVENFSGHPSSSLFTGALSASIDTTGANGPTAGQLKFTVPFQGGDDGIANHQIINIGDQISATNLYGFNLSTTNAAGFKAYKKALDILSNQDEYDINMLAMPGVIHSLHPAVTNAGIDMVEERGDAFFVMDSSIVDASVNTAINNVQGLDTNYAAVYYPWVKVLDSSINKPILVPPSVIVPGAIAASDRIGAEWFAPAGLNRGILGNVIEAKIRLNQADRDVLYDEKINPIATFPQTGVCIWGQKTLQERSTALDRINVRRLLITLKKFIASSSRFLVFEQNTIQTRNRFLNIVNPYLESVQQQQGLFAFRVQMDENNNTPDVIDRNQLIGAIYLQPTKTAEFIVLDFNILPTGATFPV